MEINSQYDFFKNIKLDDEGHMLVAMSSGVSGSGDVLFFDAFTSFPSTGSQQVIYVDETESMIYRYDINNSEYILLNSLESIEPNLGPVLDNTITTPPTNPSESDRYIIPVGATGVWSSNINDIAQWSDVDNEWQFYEPVISDKTIVTTGTNAGKVYEFNGTTWTEVIVPIINNTPFVLAGTTIDAGSDKTSRIARTGDVVVGATNTGLTGKHVVVGSSLASTYVTRNAYTPTSDITRTGKWYRVMSFDCNYSTFATHHYKFMLAFNGNSNGNGFVAEMDVLIKRQNTGIFTDVTINQTKSGVELVYDVDKNIEFLWNNTTKRVTMYFRPDENYSALSFTILTPRESANRFTFLNQYTNATDLSGEVSDVFTEKSVIIGNTTGRDFGQVSSKTKLFNETSQNTTTHLQSQTTHLFGAEYGDGTYQSSFYLNPETFSLGISDNTNSLSNNVQLDTTQNYFNLYDSNNAIGNTTTQNVGSSQETITDSNTGEYVDVFRDTISYQIQVEDGLNKKGSRLNFTSDDISIASSIEDSDKSGQIRVEGEAIILTVEDTNTSQVTTINTTVTSHNIIVDFDGTSQFSSGLAITNDGTDLVAGLFSVDIANSRTNNVVVEDDNVRIVSNDAIFSKLVLVNPQNVQVWDQTQSNLYFEAGDNGITLDALAGVENLTIKNLRTYANNADAITGGLVADQVYKTSTGELRIVI